MTKRMNWFSGIWTYYGYYRKARRLQSDWEQVKAEWNRIGGFEAGTEQLLDFLNGCSLILVEYATWTPNALDDQIAGMIRSILADHRNILESMIDRIRRGEEPSKPELSAMMETVSVSSGEYGSLMTVLYILSLVFQALQFLKTLQPDGTSKPEIEPPRPKRPVVNFVRKIFAERK